MAAAAAVMVMMVVAAVVSGVVVTLFIDKLHLKAYNDKGLILTPKTGLELKLQLNHSFVFDRQDIDWTTKWVKR